MENIKTKTSRKFFINESILMGRIFDIKFSKNAKKKTVVNFKIAHFVGKNKSEPNFINCFGGEKLVSELEQVDLSVVTGKNVVVKGWIKGFADKNNYNNVLLVTKLVLS